MIKKITPLFLVFAMFFLAKLAFAANPGSITANGSGTSYAEFSNTDAGSINFSPNGTSVSITDSAITGYAWGDVVGWINMNPTNGGVINDGSGNLSGYAWGELTGYINFAPTNGGVSIDTTTGEFSGNAWSNNFGWLEFTCPGSACVKTDWAPTVAETGGGSSGGGYLAPTEDGSDEDVTFVVNEVVVDEENNQAILELIRLGQGFQEASLELLLSNGDIFPGIDFDDFETIITWDNFDTEVKKVVIDFKEEAFSGENKELNINLINLQNLDEGEKTEATIFIQGTEDEAVILEEPPVTEPDVETVKDTDREFIGPERFIGPIMQMIDDFRDLPAEEQKDIAQTAALVTGIIGMTAVFIAVGLKTGFLASLFAGGGFIKTKDGRVIDKYSRKPIPFATVRAFDAKTKRELGRAMCDENGNYKITTPKTDVYLTIGKKNPDGSYRHVHTSEIFKSDGLVKQKLEI